MIAIKKTGEGYYLVSLPGHEEKLGKKECLAIKNEMQTIVKPHREITFNIKAVVAIDKAGLTILEELKAIADHSNCKLRFINVEPQVAKKIAILAAKKIQSQKEPEV
jgi:anti-anti-sigma regulatory factor